MSRFLGNVRQLGYVVDDIHAAIEHWTTVLGVGPFFLFPKVVALDNVYRGESRPFEVAIALSQSGPMQIELMQTLSDAPTALHGFRGLHHVAYWTDKFDELVRGREVLQQGAIGSRENRFAYLAGDPLIEISEVSGFKGRLFQHIADTCAAWDGTQPVRSL